MYDGLPCPSVFCVPGHQGCHLAYFPAKFEKFGRIEFRLAVKQYMFPANSIWPFFGRMKYVWPGNPNFGHFPSISRQIREIWPYRIPFGRKIQILAVFPRFHYRFQSVLSNHCSG